MLLVYPASLRENLSRHTLRPSVRVMLDVGCTECR